MNDRAAKLAVKVHRAIEVVEGRDDATVAASRASMTDGVFELAQLAIEQNSPVEEIIGGLRSELDALPPDDFARLVNCEPRLLEPSASTRVVVDDRPLDAVLSNRSANALRNAGIRTFGDLLGRDGKLEDIRGIGVKSITEIQDLIRREGGLRPASAVAIKTADSQPSGLIVYVDCFPVKGPRAIELTTFVQDLASQGDHKLNALEECDPAALVLANANRLNNKRIFVRSTSPMGSRLLEILEPLAAEVVQAAGR